MLLLCSFGSQQWRILLASINDFLCLSIFHLVDHDSLQPYTSLYHFFACYCHLSFRKTCNFLFCCILDGVIVLHVILTNPTELGGMAIPTTILKSTPIRLNYFLFHIRQGTKAGGKLEASIAFMQFKIGTFQQLDTRIPRPR